jgi:hypothetical protein
MTPEHMARMKREMESLQRNFKVIETSYGDDVLNLVIAQAICPNSSATTVENAHLSGAY